MTLKNYWSDVLSVAGIVACKDSVENNSIWFIEYIYYWGVIL